MRSSNQYINEDIVSNEEEEFIDKACSFSFMSLMNGDDQEHINYYINNFDYLLKYAFRINVDNKKMYLKCCSILLADHRTIRDQFRERTNLISFLLDFPNNMKSYSSKSISAYFVLMPKLILSDDHNNIFAEFLKKSFFESIIQNITMEPVCEFLITFPRGLSPSMRTELLNIGLVDLVVDMMKGSRHQMKHAVLLFINFVQQDLIIDIPAALLSKNTFEEMIKLSINEKRTDGFEFIRFLMIIQTDHYISNQWNDIYRTILSHYDDYCRIFLETNGFIRCCESLLNLICTITMVTKKINQSIIEIFLKMTEEFFSNNTNSFLHNGYKKLVIFFINANFLTVDLLQTSKLPDHIISFFFAPTNDSTNYSVNSGQVREIFKIIDPFVTSTNGFDVEKWDQVREIVQTRNNIIFQSYGKGSSTEMYTSKPGQLHYKGLVILSMLIFLLIFGIMKAK